MKTYRGTVCVSYYYDITAEAESPEDAEGVLRAMADSLIRGGNDGTCGGSEVYDIREVL